MSVLCASSLSSPGDRSSAAVDLYSNGFTVTRSGLLDRVPEPREPHSVGDCRGIDLSAAQHGKKGLHRGIDDLHPLHRLDNAANADLSPRSPGIDAHDRVRI